MIQTNYADKFKDYINLDLLYNLDDDALRLLCISRNVINPLQWLAKKEFNYDKNYEYFKGKYRNMYASSPEFSIAENIRRFIHTYFIEKVYIYSRKYDERIAFEIKSLFGSSSKLVYAAGTISAVIDKFEPELVFYPYAEEIIPVARANTGIVFAIPNYGFNIADDDVGGIKGSSDIDKNLGMYPLIRGKKEFFAG